MKKLIVLFSAVAALAACSKNEVVPAVSGENVEISYKVAPRTKADPQAFDTKNVFASWAYYLPKGKNWSDNWKDAEIYIGKEAEEGVTISYGNNVWKDQTASHYWPKEGNLTFFAYSLNRNNFDLKHDSGNTYPIVCHKSPNAYGINATIDLKDNKNLDLLVAEIAKDKTQNENIYSLNGVPTLFKHKFSRVQFAVKKKANCGNATITLNSIKFNNVVYYGTYCQYNKIGETYVKDYCKEGERRETITYKESSFVVESSDDFVPVIETNESNYIYFPQNFKNVEDQDKIATIEVKYTVKFSDDIIEECTKSLNVKEIFDSWDVGKKYIFNLIFSLDEITWAPAVEEWEPVTKEIDIKYRDL